MCRSSSGGGVENAENPFTANGMLSKKADFIITHSTITRTELHIADPDNMPRDEQPLEQQQHSGTVSAAPPTQQVSAAVTCRVGVDC